MQLQVPYSAAIYAANTEKNAAISPILLVQLSKTFLTLAKQQNAGWKKYKKLLDKIAGRVDASQPI